MRLLCEAISFQKAGQIIQKMQPISNFIFNELQSSTNCNIFKKIPSFILKRTTSVDVSMDTVADVYELCVYVMI